MSEVYKETEDYVASVEEMGGFLFLHLIVHNPKLSVIKEIREEFPQLLDKYAEEGRDLIFACSEDERSVKFWNLVHPTYQVRELGGHGWVGSWETGI